MKTFQFYGSSDDNFCWNDGINRSGDETGAYERFGAFKVVEANGDGCYVVGHYAPSIPGDSQDGVWMVGLMQLEEDKPLPGWGFQYLTHGRRYSVVLQIECPDDVQVLSWQESEEKKEGWL